MPIYEFYCADCHRVYSFRSPTADTRKRPPCPRCGRPELERRVSRFAVSKGRPEPGGGSAGAPGEGPGPPIDEERAMRAFETIGRDLEGSGDDPRQAASALRRLYDAMGLARGPGMEEALRRMEAGEDPESIEADLGDALEAEEPLATGAEPRPGGGSARRRGAPGVDETLYDL